MRFIGRLKLSIILLSAVCLIFLTLSACFSYLRADEKTADSPAPASNSSKPAAAENNNPQQTPPPPAQPPSEAVEKNPAQDPNVPAPSKTPDKMIAPDKPQGNPGQDNEDNDFSPKISTLITINETYEKLFNPELVTDDGRVRYGMLRRKRNDLMSAVNELKNLNPAVLMSLSKEQRIAFWINAYNTCVLKLIIDNYPIEPRLYMIFYPNNSVMQIPGDWRTKHFFDIQGLEYNLEEIEQEFLLDRYKDPRICFALSYASMGGAMLRNEPYTAVNVSEQLDDQVRRYLRSPHGLVLDKVNNILFLSNLFIMYQHKELFLSSEYASIRKFRDRKPEEQAWLNFIVNYLPQEDVRYLETADFTIKFIKYDWALNDAQ